MKLTKKKIKVFLEELNELTRKHQIVIGGCGCCGSPFLEAIEGKETQPEYHYNYGYYNLDWTDEPLTVKE